MRPLRPGLYCCILLLTGMLLAPFAQADSNFAIGGAHITLHNEGAGFAAGPKALHQWVRRAARAVTTYYGRFPVPRVDINLQPVSGRSVETGTTYGYGTPHMTIKLGRRAQGAALRDDWVLTHEMVHLAFPDVTQKHVWIEEGIATYVEPIARTQAGQLPATAIWGQLVQGLPKGLPGVGDRGLDHTHTWGRTYWGGALFCLLADIKIRQQTNNQKGLQDALRGILERGGNIHDRWPLQRALQAADAAVGVPVISTLYKRMANHPVRPDLDALWAKLGVSSSLLGVHFDNNAPLAAIRQAITHGGPGKPLSPQTANYAP